MAKKVKQFEDTSVSKEQSDSSTQKNPAEVSTPAKEGELSQVDRDAIVTQSIREIAFDRRYKQGKVKNWQKNEQMYYGVKVASTEARANIDLARMQEHVHTVMSKIDDPLLFKYTKRKESQLKRVQRLNALRSFDAQRDFWDIKDIVGKKQCIIYGRTAYVYYADSVENTYKPHLENIDIYDLLVDPSGGGVDVEQMMHWGRYGVVKSKEELEAGLESGDYDKDSVTALIQGSGNNTESSQEETNKMVRMYGQNTIGKKELQSDDKYKFWQWFTTYKGTRYVLTLQATAGRAIEICPLKEKFASNLWPLWTYAAFMDMTEFWTPSYCDYVREVLMTQNVTINQTVDNTEAINKPMKIVNVNAIENQAELKYRRDGTIRTKNGIEANKAIQYVTTPEVTASLLLFDKLEQIMDKSSGVTSEDKGAADLDGKVAIYKGNKQATAGRYGLFNKAYSFGYNRFALLYQEGVKEHLTKKVAVDIIGPNGIETEEVKRTDIFRKGDVFNVMVESANADKMASLEEQSARVAFLTEEVAAQNANPNAPKIINAQKAFETKAKIVGFNDDEIKELMDVSEYGDAELMSEAARDIESILDGDEIRPNQNANNAYKQRFVDYMKDHQEDMDDTQWAAIVAYVSSLDAVIYANEARNLSKFQTKLVDNQANLAAVTPVTKPTMPMNGTAMLDNSNPIQ